MAESVTDTSVRLSAATEVERQAALRALHRILVQARSLAYQRKDHAKIAAVLDTAEIVPLLLIPEEPRDLTVSDLLCGLVQQFPEFHGIAESYQSESCGQLR